MSAVVLLGGRAIGDGHPCFVIAEAGSNHNGSLDRARALIDVAVSAGADAVKFQLFRAGRMYPRGAGASDYLKTARPIYDIIQEMELPLEWLPVLAEHCRGQRILLLASAFDEESADRLDPYVTAHKIASYEMTHLPLVEHIARKGKPIIVSTGTASLDEVAVTVDRLRRIPPAAFCLMQCTAAYPAPLEAVNARAVVTLKTAFGVPVGLSDHSRDPLSAPLAAVALGANLLEKHLTLDNNLPGPDHRFAVEPPEFQLMVRKVREVEQALGSGEKSPHPVEQELRAFARRSIFALRDIALGESYTTANIAVLRCGKLPSGLPPAAYPDVVGRRAAQAVRAETAVQSADVG